MTRAHDLTRRDFIAATTTALVAAERWPAPPGPVETVVLFQGDSITDCGRNRADAGPNTAGALGIGYPLLVASAALAAHPDRGLRFFNRGISGNTVPDLQERWATDTLALRPDVLSILIGVNDNWHRSEEHTSELQSRLHLVCRLLLEKKKKRKKSAQIEEKHVNRR